ncbi:hypothetical protein Tco_1220064 [Tanacetum coccineum]
MDLSSVTIAKGGSQISKQCTNPKKKGMIRGNFLTPQTSHTVITTMLLIKPMIWMPMTLIGMNLTPAKIALMVNLSRNGSDALTESGSSKPKLYDGNVILKMDTIVIPNSDETLILCEESRSKMLLKEQDPLVKATSVPALDPSHSSTTIKVEAPKELPKVSMVYTSLKELKRYH